MHFPRHAFLVGVVVVVETVEAQTVRPGVVRVPHRPGREPALGSQHRIDLGRGEEAGQPNGRLGQLNDPLARVQTVPLAAGRPRRREAPGEAVRTRSSSGAAASTRAGPGSDRVVDKVGEQQRAAALPRADAKQGPPTPLTAQAVHRY